MIISWFLKVFVFSWISDIIMFSQIVFQIDALGPNTLNLDPDYEIWSNLDGSRVTL